MEKEKKAAEGLSLKSPFLPLPDASLFSVIVL